MYIPRIRSTSSTSAFLGLEPFSISMPHRLGSPTQPRIGSMAGSRLDNDVRSPHLDRVRGLEGLQESDKLDQTSASGASSILSTQRSHVIEIYGYIPAWGLPDISPYVTKTIYWMKMNKVPYDYKNQDFAKFDEDAPFGKLPYIIDTDDNTKVADTNVIIPYLAKKYKVNMDEGQSKSELAVQIAFDRLLGEHLYFSGVLQPRWRMDEGWEIYIPYIVGGAEVGPDLRAFLDGFRKRILDGFNGQGMGRRDDKTVLEFYKADLDALSDFLADKPYFMGDKVRTIDAAAYALLRHLNDQPQKWDGTGYLATKKNLADYLVRMRKEYDM